MTRRRQRSCGRRDHSPEGIICSKSWATSVTRPSAFSNSARGKPRKIASRPTPDQIQRMGKAGEGVERIYSPRGCPKCVGTGFMGRRGVFELLTVNEEMREVIMKSPSVAEIMKTLSSTKFVKLSQSGYQLVADGMTSLDEIERSM